MAQATFASSRDRIPAITRATLGSALGTLRTRLSSGAQVIAPGAPAYNRRRMLLNRQFDYKPAVLVRCATEGDVTLSIWFARQHQLRIAIRSGGTSPGGFSSNDGGMVIDLPPMKSIVVGTGGDTDLAQEPVLIDDRRDRRTKGLEGDVPPMLEIARQKNVSHPASADMADHLIAPRERERQTIQEVGHEGEPAAGTLGRYASCGRTCNRVALVSQAV